MVLRFVVKWLSHPSDLSASADVIVTRKEVGFKEQPYLAIWAENMPHGKNICPSRGTKKSLVRDEKKVIGRD